MTDFVRMILELMLAGIILELLDVYGNKTTMIMPTEMVNCNKSFQIL